MEVLRKAIARRKSREPGFTGTPYAISRECVGVSHQQILNLLRGTTPPWNVRVATMQELCRIFRDIQPAHFYRPKPPSE